MGTKRTRDLPARLERLRQRFERWRGTHKTRSRIPELLWGSAVKMAGTYGLNQTARTLRLDYYALKKRVTEGAVAVHRVTKRGGKATFVELPPAVQTASGECVLEVENAGGAKMRMHLKGVAMPDLVALSRSFWNHQP